MRKINRAPETRAENDLYYTYSREDLRRETRYPDGRRPSARSWNGHKILLFDLLFLFIIGGVIVPFMINRNLSGKIDALSFVMELRRENDAEVFISLHIINTGKEILSDEPIEVELEPQDSDSRSYSELPPAPGGERVLRYRLDERDDEVSVYCRITWKEKNIRLNGKI